ncbi:hypothetical protein IMSHALPRED_000887 [Imshaugia aleurites]|uniref:Uncharacterized protein n=1 Tax=Imshaugia aleurites TaxID=172621 RepID=A0A8H3EUT5_9LECA|nr:hypothetical protein IMSHALPRED_000887 [Imshaugia aleurites]
MSVAKVRRLVAFKDYTHTLSIPLNASASISQLHNSFLRFQNDASLTVPSAAICNPDFYNIYIARLNLPTSRHVDDFSAILRKYDMREVLKAAAIPLRLSSCLESGTTSCASIIEENNMHAGLLPLRINVLGLNAAKPQDPASTTRLDAKPIDPTNRLPLFLLCIRNFLAGTGFMTNPGNENRMRQYTGDNVAIVNTVLLQWYNSKGHFNEELGMQRKTGRKVFEFDARELIDKYQTYEWGSDIPLEKMCLEKVGGFMGKREDGAAVERGRTVFETFWLP